MKCGGEGGATERVGRRGCGTRGQIGLEADRSPSTGSSPLLGLERTWVSSTDREMTNGEVKSKEQRRC